MIGVAVNLSKRVILKSFEYMFFNLGLYKDYIMAYNLFLNIFTVFYQTAGATIGLIACILS